MTDEESLRPLGGELPVGGWNFIAPHGPLPNPIGHTFPILKQDEGGLWNLIGTGFYISDDGLFVTAKHVITDVIRNDRQISAVAILHLHSERGGFFGPDSFLMRPIGQCWLADRADIALGVAATATNDATGETLSNPAWPLSWIIPPVGSRVGTYAFPNHAITTDRNGQQTLRFRPDVYLGVLEESADFRDSVIMPVPFVRTNFRMHAAASGGPIWTPGGGIIGINCSEYAPEIAYGVQIRCLEGSFVDDALPLGENAPRRVTFREIVASGWINALQYAPNMAPHQAGNIVRLDQIQPMPTRNVLILDTSG